MTILDKKIKPGKRPLTCLDVDQAREFEGKKCLFSDSYVNYKNIKEYAKYPQYTGILHIEEDTKRFRAKEDYVFRNGTDGYCYSLCLPLDWIEQGPGNKINFEQYRLETFEKEFNIGDVVTFKGKPNTDRFGSYFKCVYSGYRIFPDDIIVFFGSPGFTFSELFDLYEINRDGNWEPFGRKVENIDICAGS